MAKGGLLDALKNDPATKQLTSAAAGFAAAKAADVAGKATTRLVGGKPKGGDGGGESESDGGEAKPEKSGKGFFKTMTDAVTGGGDKGSDSSGSDSGGGGSSDSGGVSLMDRVKGGAMSGAGEATSSGTNKIFGGLKGAVKGLLSRKGKAAKRPTNIYEDYVVPLSAQKTYEAWKKYNEHASYMKGIEKVDITEAQGEPGEDGFQPEQTGWTAKIFLNRRSWKATTKEDVEAERIRWTSEGAKGTVDGMVAFIPIGDNACRFVYILEYRPKGFFEWWGNRWRTVGRRSRLDVKHFIRHTSMLDQTEDREAEEAEAAEQDSGSQDGETDVRQEEDAEPGTQEDAAGAAGGEADEGGREPGEEGGPSGPEGEAEGEGSEEGVAEESEPEPERSDDPQLDSEDDSEPEDDSEEETGDAPEDESDDESPEPSLMSADADDSDSEPEERSRRRERAERPERRERKPRIVRG